MTLLPARDTSGTSAVIADPQARRLVRKNLFDRVVVLPDKLEFALLPLAVFNALSSSDAVSSKSACAELSSSHPVVDEEEEDEPETVYLTVEEHLIYARFFGDFGPLDLGQTVRFCRDLSHRLAASTTARIVLVSSDHAHKRANVMALLALFLVCVHKHTPQQAIAPFRTLRPAQGFRDAACGLCTFFLTVYDCARAVHKAIHTNVWNYDAFSLDAYEYYDKLHNGDINWIVPGKILAFSGPQRERVTLDASGRTTLLAHEYAAVFQKLGVSCVVRFNEANTYDRRAFIHANIRHLDMQYPDGGNPTDEILFKFIRTCERESGAVAVHCKAGLGRTGTNIAAYLMKVHGFSAAEAIAWCRICRPGSIVGPQQQYLVVKQPQLWQLGAKTQAESTGDQDQKQQQDTKGPQEALVRVKKQSFSMMLQRLPSASTTSSRPPSTSRGPRSHVAGDISSTGSRTSDVSTRR